jgi:hypothetical protein
LPNHLKSKYAKKLKTWLSVNGHIPKLHEYEINHLQRLIDYLDVVKTPHGDTCEIPKLHNDFKQFFTQYDRRRGKNFVQTFPQLTDWYNDIQV